MEQKQKTIDWSNFNPKLFSKNNFLEKELCLEIIEFAESSKFQRHSSGGDIWKVDYFTAGIPIDTQVNNKLHKSLESVWQEAIDYYKFNVDYVEPYEVKKYQFMDYVSDHIDQFFGSAEIERKLSMVIQLSDSNDYKGGNLKLLRRFNFDRNIGSVVVFPSFYPHEVTKVTKGIRYSINSWAWGPFWK